MRTKWIVSLCLAAACSFGQLLSFNPSGVDADVNAVDLNATTTGTVGGSWGIDGTPESTGNAKPAGSQYVEYTNSDSDYFMVWDYVKTSGNSLDLTLNSAQSFDSAPLVMSWDIASTRADNNSKKMAIIGYGADGVTEAFRFDWYLEDQMLYANGLNRLLTEMGTFGPSVLDGIKTLDISSEWMSRMAITLNGTSITYSADGVESVTLEVLNGQTSISKIRFEVAVAANGVGIALDDVNIMTGLPASIVSFSATPDTFDTGDSVTLSWEVLDADTITIDNDIGPVAAIGSMDVFPTNATTWTLSAVRGDVTVAEAVSVSFIGDELYEGPEYEDAYKNPDDNPDLPNVLLIGDSISIGYTVQVRKSLAGKADVYRIPSNGKYASFGLGKLDDWIGTREWDVIHFNWGLWDLCYRNSESKNQGGRDKIDGVLTATPEEYGATMEQIVTRLKETGASLMWCATTPVPEGELGRVEGDDLIYNAVAAEIMATNNIPTDDLHSYALLELPGIQKDDGDVHFSNAGYVYLGEKVALEIEGLLFEESVIEDLGIGVQQGGTELAISWTAVPGVSYSVLTTTNLVDGPWTEITNGITGDDLITVMNNSDKEQEFFHVIPETE